MNKIFYKQKKNILFLLFNIDFVRSFVRSFFYLILILKIKYLFIVLFSFVVFVVFVVVVIWL
jgi:hypothetical protein